MGLDVDSVSRIVSPVGGGRDRKVALISTAPEGFEGEGFPVRRAFAGVPRDLLDPFIHMDQMGRVDYAPYEPRGTDWHPHRGFETVTYMLDGEFQHQDSHGGGGTIRAGDTQWMTAGGGILHIETPPEHLVVSGGVFHGVQLWVNLPGADKFIAPAYQHLEGSAVPVLLSADGGARVRLIAGELAGRVGPGSTRTPIVMLHATVKPGVELELPWDTTFNALAYVLDGVGAVGAEQVPVQLGQLAVFEAAGDTLRFRGGAFPLEVLVLGGRPIGEPVAQWGPFVMNTRAELQQALDDYRAGRLGVIPDDGLQPWRPTRRSR
jgi:redox-sensitive bicupin YhaK (pirin superfamily)